MAPPKAAATVQLSDLGSYQHAVRLVLTNDVITAARPRPGVLEQVLRWADQMTGDFRGLLGYTLIATTRQVRLNRRIDKLIRRAAAARPARPVWPRCSTAGRPKARLPRSLPAQTSRPDCATSGSG